jgi:hypothetical protein
VCELANRLGPHGGRVIRRLLTFGIWPERGHRERLAAAEHDGTHGKQAN